MGRKPGIPTPLDLAHREVFSTGQIARVCGVSTRTAKNWMDDGLLKAYRLPVRVRENLISLGVGANVVAGDRRVTRASLVKFMKENNIPLPKGLAVEQETGETVPVPTHDLGGEG